MPTDRRFLGPWNRQPPRFPDNLLWSGTDLHGVNQTKVP